MTQILRWIVLCIPLFGTQIAWSFEFSYGTPLLLSRGFTPFLTTLVWLAGPLTGLIIQPLFGAISDNYKSEFGKRRPFILIGWLATFASLVLLMWNTSPFPIMTSFVAFYMLDASLNVSMAAIRALMIDKTDSTEQVSLNAWASRIVGAGSIFGYVLSTIDLGFTNQVYGVALVTLILLTGSTMVTIFNVKEDPTYARVENMEELENFFNSPEDESRLKESIMKIWSIAKNVPNEPELVYIYRTQFFSWIAWFPILFYNSAWLSSLAQTECPTCSFDEIIRRSSSGMFYFSIVAFISSIFVPFLFEMSVVSRNRTLSIHMLWCLSQASFAGFALSIFLTSLIGKITFQLGTILISGLGFSWAITTWIPFVLLSEYTITDRPEDAGSLLGLTNIFTVLPQFLSIAFCSMILWFTSDFWMIFLLAGISSLLASISCII